MVQSEVLIEQHIVIHISQVCSVYPSKLVAASTAANVDIQMLMRNTMAPPSNTYVGFGVDGVVLLSSPVVQSARHYAITSGKSCVVFLSTKSQSQISAVPFCIVSICES
jgi:hypothetical protein